MGQLYWGCAGVAAYMGGMDGAVSRCAAMAWCCGDDGGRRPPFCLPVFAGNHTGCLVIDVAGWTNAVEHLKKDDVVISIDGRLLLDVCCVAAVLPFLSPFPRIRVYIENTRHPPNHNHQTGHKLQSDKTVPFKDNDFIPFEFLMSYHFVGDDITMEVVRKETDAVRCM